jgi:hypothetical protein
MNESREDWFQRQLLPFRRAGIAPRPPAASERQPHRRSDGRQPRC